MATSTMTPVNSSSRFEESGRDPASFRDPSGHIFRDAEGALHRRVNPSYLPHYERLMRSGLYDRLVKEGLLVEHSEVETQPGAEGKLLRPRELPWISHPYEWSFGMLRDAALLTLKIQRRALEHGMSLKDASAYNVQFEGAKPVFIDTLSFEPYEERKPWVAYGQFCQHFLAPLALMSWRDVRLIRMLTNHLDGIPLDLAVSLLPRRALWRPGLMIHLWLHSKAIRKHHVTSGLEEPSAPARGPSKGGLLGIVESLERTVRSLKWKPKGTEWVDYYSDCTYTQAMSDFKAQWVQNRLRELRPGTVWDLGANTGLYSRVARECGAYVVSLDIDPACVERNYQQAKERGEERVLPLWGDLTNPSPGLGWAHRERASLTDRGPADAVLALALIHHLALGNNVPLPIVADWLAQLGEHLLIEFVPKSDPQSKRLLRSRADIFPDYTPAGLEEAMRAHFTLLDSQPVPECERVLYHFAAK